MYQQPSLGTVTNKMSQVGRQRHAYHLLSHNSSHHLMLTTDVVYTLYALFPITLILFILIILYKIKRPLGILLCYLSHEFNVSFPLKFYEADEINGRSTPCKFDTTKLVNHVISEAFH